MPAIRLEHETDRVRFIGRNRTLARPLAITARTALGGAVGNVLDPVLALRRCVRLEPAASAVFDVVLAAAESREDAVNLGRDVRNEVERVFEGAAEREHTLRRRLGLDDRAAETLQELASTILYGGTPFPAAEQASAYWQALGLNLTPPETTDLPAPARGGARGARRTYAAADRAAASAAESVQLDNGYGGFSEDGSEYVVIGAPPMPWINVVANERCGFLASESGAGYTWSANSRENRLTPWSNDPVIDPHGEALYVRDETRRRFWPALPGPAQNAEPCETRHGIGYSRWRHVTDGLEHEILAFVPRHDPVITWLTLRNPGRRALRLSIFSYAQLVLGVLPAETSPSIVTEIDRERETILARNPRRGEFSELVAFAALVKPAGAGPVEFGCDRTTFLGRNGSALAPAAVAHASALDGRAGAGLDPCAVLQLRIDIPAGGSVECAVLLGEVADAAEAHRLIELYRSPGAIEAALAEVRTFWKETLSAVEVETPSPAIDRMLNGWLLYQCLACRIWGRSAFYQSGGAFGFRDQLQDSAALVASRPDLTRAQIVLHAGHQFVEGDVLHWWHPPADRGTRTRCSDDLLWLPYLTAFYIGATGDVSVLDEQAGFLSARLLEPGEDETYLQPSPSGKSGDVYEHCLRAIDRSLVVGAHGLTLIGTCDWNDGMNRVGREGKGESIWLGFFLYSVLGSFAPLCERRR